MLDGIIGSGGFGSKPILSRFYDKTGGDRNKLRKLSGRLLQLLTGGLSALMAVEVIGTESEYVAAHYVNNRFGGKLAQAASTMKKYLDLCVFEAKSNMQKDLERIVEEKNKQPNKNIAHALCESLKNKYDWLLFHCMVYNDIAGFEKHIFNGIRVSKLHYFGKNAIAFYTSKGSFRQAEHIHTVNSLISQAQTQCYRGWWTENSGCHDTYFADSAYSVLKKGLDSKHIGIWGVAVIKRHVDLRYYSSAGNRVIWTPGRQFFFLVLLY